MVATVTPLFQDAALGPVMARYGQRRFRVVVASASHSGARQLAQGSNVNPEGSDVVPLETVIQRVEHGLRSGVPWFDRPTAVMVAGLEQLEALGLSARWETVMDAAKRSPCEVVFVCAQTPSIDATVARQVAARPAGPRMR